MPRPRVVPTIDERTGCWNINQRVKYPIVSRNGKSRRAARVYYEEHRGPIPEGLTIDHLCFNTRCVNPDHLEAVTPAVNCQRRRSTRLSAEKVAEIRSLLDRDWLQQDIADAYGVQQPMVSRIKTNQTWRAEPSA